MITVKLNGGLGNQMFQYACGRAITEKVGEDLMLDTSFFDIKSQTKRIYMLSKFNIRAQIINPEKNVLRLLKNIIQKQTIFNEQGYTYNRKIEAIKGNCILNGYWQSPKYFKSMHSEILKELKPKEKISLPSHIANILTNNQTVSIHVRRGDYVTNKEAIEILGALPLSYYRKAIERINRLAKNVYCIVISDDIEWCKSNLNKIVGKRAIFFSKDEMTDMYVMTQVNHNIIANSSYSWWGAYLNQNKEKIVIAPRKWFKNKAYSTKDLFPQNWIQV